MEQYEGKVKVVRTGKYAHACYEWDEMLIDEGDPEFESCLCFRDDPEAQAIQDKMAGDRLNVTQS